MKKTFLCQIKSGNSIRKQGRYVVIYWKSLWVVQPDGTLIFQRKDIKFVKKIAFVGNDRLLVGSHKAYYLINLLDGTDIWSIPCVKNVETASGNFAVTPDCSYAYDYFRWHDKVTIVAINIKQGTTYSYPLDGGLRATVDIACDENGVLCVLQGQSEQIGDKKVSQSGILYQYQEDTQRLGDSYYWKQKWTLDAAFGAKAFLGSVNAVMTRNMHVYEPATGRMYDPLENSKDYVFSKVAACGAISSRLDESGRYLHLTYMRFNLVVDLPIRKIVGRYAAKTTAGCVVENEYWVSSDSGIRRLPFPMIEEMDPRTLYSDWIPLR